MEAQFSNVAHFGQLNSFHEGINGLDIYKSSTRRLSEQLFFSDRLKSFHKYGLNKKTRSTIVFFSDRLKSFHQLEMFLSLSTSKSSLLENSFRQFGKNQNLTFLWRKVKLDAV